MWERVSSSEKRLVFLRSRRIAGAVVQQRRRKGKVQNLLGNFLRGQDEIRQTGVDRAAGHAVKLGAFRRLRDDKAAAFFDRLDPVGTVRPGAGTNTTTIAFSRFSSAREVKKISIGWLSGAGVIV